jgi:hypothetical protein
MADNAVFCIATSEGQARSIVEAAREAGFSQSGHDGTRRYEWSQARNRQCADTDEPPARPSRSIQRAEPTSAPALVD